MSYVSSVNTSAHSKDLDPVSVIADAENRSNTRAYQTVSGDTIKAPLLISCCLIMAMSKQWLPWKGFGQLWREWIAVSPMDTIVFGMTQHQTVTQSKMTLALGWFLEFQCLEERSYLKYNTYNQYKPYNTKWIKIYVPILFQHDSYYCLWESNKSQQTP